MSSINYDYIIIGSGSAGSALASVLATKGKTLLIERGANHTSYPQSAYRQGWPQIVSLALESIRNEGSGHWTGTANILGGGSALNSAVCWRGERKIFTELGFDLEKVQESFEFLEDRICLQTEDTEVIQEIENAWSELGFHLVTNSTHGLASWNEDHDGDGAVPTIQRARSLAPISKKRMPSSALYELAFNENESSILAQGNLTVFLLTKAKKILFNDAKDAIGVEVASPAGEFPLYVRANGKVFLSAGVYESPKLLMLSGIGPRDTLNEFGIPIVYENNEVGKNLIDRKAASLLFPLGKSLGGDDTLMSDVAAIGEKYWSSVSHKYSIPWGSAAIGCINCAPENRTKSCFEQLLSALLFYGSGMSSVSLPIYVAQRYPKTRGFVSLASLDYNVPPTVHDGWTMDLSNLSSDARHDFDELKEGVFELILNTLQNSSMLESLGFSSNLTGAFSQDLMEILSASSNSYSASQSLLDKCTYSELFRQGAECDSWDSCFPTTPTLSKDPIEIEKSIFDLLASYQHGSGTCKVGTVVEKGTLAVKGVKGLYVSDLSVVAGPVDIHPMMTAMTIGLMVGNNVDSVPLEDYDAFPITLSIFFITLVVSLLLFWLVKRIQKRNEETEDETSSAPRFTGRASISSIFTSMRAIPKSALERTIVSSIKEGIEEDEEYIEKSPATTALMSWTDVSCTYESGRGEKKKSVTTLSKNFGSMNEGEVTAIMGPSGAAKSTLLDILSGRKSIGMVRGNFSLFGREYNVTENGLAQLSAEIQGNSVYIPQQEYFYPTQTCAEAIQFQANMKFGRGEENARRKLVHSCLSIVGLPPKTFTTRIIGGELAGGITIRGLSGGERKRLALACMLALKPKMMFIDELTSGLDSENSYLIMKLLKDLSRRKQVASMVIIHQPDPETFALFDNLILLSKGRCVFSGNMLEIDSFYERNYDEAVPADGYLAGDLIKKASAYDGEHPDDYKGVPLEVFHTKTLFSTTYNPGKSWKLYTVFNRNLSNQYIRNVTNATSRFASYVGLAAVIGAIFWQVGKPDEANNLSYDDAPLIIGSSIFLLNVAYLLPFATIPVFVSDKKFLAAESSLGLYPSWMYGVSQIFLEFVFLSLTMTAVTIVAFYMCAMGNPTMPEWSSFLTVLSTLIMSGLVGSSMVLMTTIWLPTQDLAFLSSSTLVTISLALSGAFLPFANMPALPNALQWISPVKYSFQALVTAQITGTGAERVLYVGELNTPSTVSENLAVLCGLFIGFSILIAIGMARVKEIR